MQPIGSGFAKDSNHRRCQMHGSNICLPITGDCDTILVSIELSQRTWLVTMKCPGKDRFSHYKLPGGIMPACWP